MARKKSAAKPDARPEAPTKAARPPEPGAMALSRIAALIARGTSPVRVRHEVDSIVDSWLANAAELERMEIRERLDEMQEQLAEGEESARTMIDDIDQDDKDGKAAVATSQRNLAALQAARAAVVTAAQRV